jgi:hypothetical protein
MTIPPTPRAMAGASTVRGFAGHVCPRPASQGPKKTARRRLASDQNNASLLDAARTRAISLVGIPHRFPTYRFHRFSAGVNGAARNVDDLSEASIAFFDRWVTNSWLCATIP